MLGFNAAAALAVPVKPASESSEGGGMSLSDSSGAQPHRVPAWTAIGVGAAAVIGLETWEKVAGWAPG